MKGRFAAEVQDADFATHALPALLQTRARLLADFSGKLTAEKQAQAVDDLGALAHADYANGTLSREGVATLHRELAAVLGYSESNQALVNVMRSVAVEAGDPAIMDLIPDHIDTDDRGRLPGLRDIPRYSIQIEAAKREAAGYGITREQLREQADEKAREERRAAVDAEVTDAILAGKPYLGSIRGALERGEIDGARARTLAAFGESMASASRRTDGSAVDVGGVADIQLGIASGDMDTSDVQQAFTDGRLGDPGDPAVKEAAAKLLNGARAAGNAALRSAQTINYRKMLESHYPVTDGLGFPKPELAQRRADKVTAFNELLLNGAEPEKAAREVLDADGLSLNDPPKAATSSLDSEQAATIRDVATGAAKFDEVPRISVAEVMRLVAAGLVDRQSAEAYLKKVR